MVSYLLGHPNVNTKASTAASRNRISNRRSPIGAGLADQLVHPLVAAVPSPRAFDVGRRGPPRRLAVEADREAHGASGRRWAHDEVQVTGVEAVGDGTVGLVQQPRHCADPPVPRQGPLVEPATRPGPSRRGACPARRPRGGEAHGALIAGVVSPVIPGWPSRPGPPGRGRDATETMSCAGRSGLAQQLLDAPSPTGRIRPRRSGGAGYAPARRRSRARASSGCRRPANGVVVVDRDRVADLHVLHGLPDVAGVVLERELRVWTPITTSPWLAYFSAQART